jgi:hypothetical protein
MTTTLTRELARQQAARLQSSPMLAPQSDEGRREVVNILMRHCQNAEHAATVLTALLEECRDPRNLTAELVAIARNTKRKDNLPPGCDACYAGEDLDGAPSWLPFVTVQIRGYSAGRRCACARGQWLSARDRQREAEQLPGRSSALVGVNEAK